MQMSFNDVFKFWYSMMERNKPIYYSRTHLSSVYIAQTIAKNGINTQMWDTAKTF